MQKMLFIAMYIYINFILFIALQAIKCTITVLNDNEYFMLIMIHCNSFSLLQMLHRSFLICKCMIYVYCVIVVIGPGTNEN